ncbi:MULTISPECIES: DUF2946 domain-containing protein [unclassified Undibacterium]|uniref:DUF2946 domain-containing protein n=1 Tax=unclassified Undibacterium TaxID=2630295 RepID=UPI002AC92B0D|nr:MULTISPECIES: DUF2946 domain-containing protein [unclassified Undibacterium]MEB0139652.1 DUF2946 domain-containing protein [Undibacterium sp. CCC2.1]MEB0172533.1 DUF2946 domain-containing protein [Undibacterium sp. CCC1.1]MEB0176372.1 DUF2946 domain-containing protein [Undibacterium sp. CCC3.4]MEB0215706.1 DUF2946 domain-containing protein [Undibacterium sp. 5I2]WPX42983.1 DUF2946 domain-containing protein [Undibacterium sp. CCC3.4]
MKRISYNIDMGMMSKRTTLYIWIACFAMLFNLLAPSLSHAFFAADGKASWVEVCSLKGSKFVSVAQDTSGNSGQDNVLHHMEHCAFCASHAGAFVIPSNSSTLFSVIGGHDLFPPLFYQSPSPLFSWSEANPRGPPSIT